MRIAVVSARKYHGIYGIATGVGRPRVRTRRRSTRRRTRYLRVEFSNNNIVCVFVETSYTGGKQKTSRRPSNELRRDETAPLSEQNSRRADVIRHPRLKLWGWF